MEFSVLISIYYKETASNFDEALKSILIDQSILPNEVVIVKDGPITSELEEIIKKYQLIFNEIIKIVTLNQNMGLGYALNEGLKHCKYDIIARMDSDDISTSSRFELQLKFLEINPDIDVIGGNISEFYTKPTEIIAERIVPSTMKEIKNMMKQRNPMNHVTVMFKKKAVYNAEGYKHLPYLEDYYLWIRMIDSGSIFANINTTLVYVRTGADMYKRRGNRETIKGWKVIQLYLYKMGEINRLGMLLNNIKIRVFTYMPVKLKEFIYTKFLRK